MKKQKLNKLSLTKSRIAELKKSNVAGGFAPTGTTGCLNTGPFDNNCNPSGNCYCGTKPGLIC